MNHQNQLLEFVKRLDDLPVGQNGPLKMFLTDLKFFIGEAFGSDCEYLDYIKRVKFRPEAVFVTEGELRRCWIDGVAQIANLLKVILHDDRLNNEKNSTEQPLSQDNKLKAQDVTSHIQLSMSQMAQDIKQSMNEDVLEEQGALKEPLRKELLASTDQSKSESLLAEESSPARVLLMPGSDRLINDELMAFLSTLKVNIKTLTINDDQSLTEQLDSFAQCDFAIVVLSADYYGYLRTQNYECAEMMTSQETSFRLGYLVSKIGKQKVMVLYEENSRFRRPTDYFDLHYTAFNPMGSWKKDIINRMKFNQPTVHA